MHYNISGLIKQATDPRDFQFSTTVTEADLPASVDLFNTPLGPLGEPFEPAWDQENIGSCGPNTAAELLVYCLMAFGSSKVVKPSRLFIYYVVRMLMRTIGQDSGVDNRTMLKALAQFGWCPEEMWHYITSKFTQRPSQECFDEAAKNKIVQYRAVAQTLHLMKACLAGDNGQQGRPFIFGFSVFPSMMTDEVAETGDIPDPHPGEQPIGGHDVLIGSYGIHGDRFTFKNHWKKPNGEPWGKNGYGTISYKYATNPELASDFWTIYTPGSFSV